MQSLKQVYRNKTILVTGDTGFKGAWLSLWLEQLGAKVIGYALDPPGQPNLFDAIGLAGTIIHIHGDVRDYSGLIEVIIEHQPEIIFHLAAQSLVRASYEEPRLTYETNVMGTVNLLEAARHTPSVRAVVVVTSDKCYENREWVWGYREQEPMGGRDPYSSSKGCCELVTAAYLHSYFSPEQYGKTHGIALASARAGNVIGGGDWGKDRLIPDCVRALSRKEEIILRHPNAIRPWQYVLEPLSGYLLLGASLFRDGPNNTGSWNFGPSDAETLTVGEMVNEIIRLWGEGSYRVESDGQPHEAHWLKLDCSKARGYLGWRPRYNVQTALNLSIDWYRLYYAGNSKRDLRHLMTSQIGAYMAGRSHKAHIETSGFVREVLGDSAEDVWNEL
ncbi:MAG TPA: CDP-glucose 4,6-dehydratase [Deltaproteobacteria bacterium]|jgi:CDP-glucose 4,6-dehydratase|nr:CDP-glucose 4,6-dehydratase [Deltaproteobacteria bacterium]